MMETGNSFSAVMAVESAGFARLAEVLLDGIDSREHLGGQVYISRKGVELLDCSFGWNDSDRLSQLEKDSLILWRSAGKPLTAIFIAILVSQGKIEFDTPIVAIVPEFLGDGRDGITVRHLLTHTAGLRGGDRLNESLGWEEMLNRLLAIIPEDGWIPGERAGYHIAGSWYLLGEICSRLMGGITFSELIRKEILLPLGMEKTWVGIPEDLWDSGYSEKISSTYITSADKISKHPYLDLKWSCCQCRPGGNARGPVRDLGKFYEWVEIARRGEVPFLASEIIERMLRPARPPGLFDETFRHQMDWGLGFMVNSARYGRETVPYGFGRYASEETYGHGGAQCCSGFADPSHDLVVCWAVNGLAGEISHQRRIRRINDAIYEDLGLVG